MPASIRYMSPTSFHLPVLSSANLITLSLQTHADLQWLKYTLIATEVYSPCAVPLRAQQRSRVTVKRYGQLFHACSVEYNNQLDKFDKIYVHTDTQHGILQYITHSHNTTACSSCTHMHSHPHTHMRELISWDLILYMWDEPTHTVLHTFTRTPPTYTNTHTHCNQYMCLNQRGSQL